MDALWTDLSNLASCCLSSDRPSAPESNLSALRPTTNSRKNQDQVAPSAESTMTDEDACRVAARKIVKGAFDRAFAKRIVHEAFCKASSNLAAPTYAKRVVREAFLKASSNLAAPIHVVSPGAKLEPKIPDIVPVVTPGAKKSNGRTPKRSQVPHRRKDSTPKPQNLVAQASPTAKSSNRNAKSKGKGKVVTNTPVKELSAASPKFKGGKGNRGAKGKGKGKGKGRRPRRASDTSESPL